MPRRRTVVRAHAKINLDLRILGRRRDGFHELRTVFQSIDLHDTLTVLARPGPFALRCRDRAVPTDATNLIWRAAAAAAAVTGRGPLRELAVTLDKRIPMDAGLGGGSADAAAMLRALGRFWPDLTPEAQRDLAVDLGADVAFFLLGGTALGLGRGEQLFPLVDLPMHWIVLLVPAFGVPTADAYAWHDRTARRPAARVSGEPIGSAAGLLGAVVEGVNDLEPVVAAKHPEIARMHRALGRAGALRAAMSGSGSCVFGLFSRRREAVAAAASLGRRSRRAIVTRTLDRAAAVSRPR